MIKIAGIQMEPLIKDNERNLARCIEFMKTVAKDGTQMIIFPEAALSGYVFHSLEEALPYLEPVPGPSTEIISDYCRKLNVNVIIGILEQDGSKYYNTAAFIGPHGFVGKYRKLHLPYVGIDRFLNHGDLPLNVYDTDVGKIGLGVCYDLDFPEHSRSLAILGAEVIVTVTNWPEGIEFIPEHVIQTRAYENHVYLIAVNRVGNERGIRFFGRSKVVDYTGISIVEAKPYQEDILYAEIDPSLAREKFQVIVPGEIEIDCIRDRRPEFYGTLTQSLVDNSRIR